MIILDLIARLILLIALIIGIKGMIEDFKNL